MKKLFLVFASLSLVLPSCGGGGDTVVGTWQLESVTGEELTDSEKGAIITFNEDGSCEQRRGDQVRKAKWELSEDHKTLTITAKGRGPETMENLVITADKLTFEDRGETVTVKRIK